MVMKNGLYFIDGVSGWEKLNRKEEYIFVNGSESHLKLWLGERFGVHPTNVEIVNTTLISNDIYIQIKEPEEWLK